MNIVNKLHRFFHTPLTGKQLVVLVSIVIVYSCIVLLVTFEEPKLALNMYISFIIFILSSLAVIKLCDYLYKKQKAEKKVIEK